MLSGTKTKVGGVGGEVVTYECGYSVEKDGDDLAFCELPTPAFEGLVGVAVKLQGVVSKLTKVTLLDSVAGVTYS